MSECKHVWKFQTSPLVIYCDVCDERLHYTEAEAMLNAHASLTEKVERQGYQSCVEMSVALYEMLTTEGNEGIGKAVFELEDGGIVVIETPEYAGELRALLESEQDDPTAPDPAD